MYWFGARHFQGLQMRFLKGPLTFYPGATLRPNVHTTYLPRGIIFEVLVDSRSFGKYDAIKYSVSSPKPSGNISHLLSWEDIILNASFVYYTSYLTYQSIIFICWMYYMKVSQVSNVWNTWLYRKQMTLIFTVPSIIRIKLKFIGKIFYQKHFRDPKLFFYLHLLMFWKSYFLFFEINCLCQ